MDLGALGVWAFGLCMRWVSPRRRRGGRCVPAGRRRWICAAHRSRGFHTWGDIKVQPYDTSCSDPGACVV